MNDEISRIFAAMLELPGFAGLDQSDINACGTDDDNALHYVVRRADVAAARALIDAGININKAGDLGYTPLHVACMQGNLEMVRLLVEKGADLFALSEGHPPFTSARLAGHDEICDFLQPLIGQAISLDQDIWLRARIAQLHQETAYLEGKLEATLSRRRQPNPMLDRIRQADLGRTRGGPENPSGPGTDET